MRKSFVFYALIPLIILITVLYFFLDGWIESGLEFAGEKAVGAKVEIDHLQLTLSPIGIQFARLQVANPRDPWKNIFETGKVQFSLNFGQLLRGKFIIETMEMNNLILATKRTTDGSLPAEPVKKNEETTTAASNATSSGSISEAAQPSLEKSDAATPSFDLDRIKKELKIDSLLNPNNLASLKLLDSLKLQVDSASKQWDATLADIDKSKQRVNEIETSIKAIDVNNIKTIDAAKSALDNVTKTYKNASELVTTFNAQKAAITSQVGTLSGSFGKIDDVAKQDFKSVVSLAKLPDVNMQGLSQMVLGKDVLKQVHDYMYWIDFARTKIPQYTSKPDPNQPKRMEGINIHFPVDRAYPKFWIRKILISGGTDAQQDPNFFYAKGQILDISNDQRITGKPIVVDMRAEQGRGTKAEILASFDRRKELPVDHYRIGISGVPVGPLQTGRSDFLPSDITNAVGGASIDIDVPGKHFDANIAAALSGLKMNFRRDAKNVVERIVQDVLRSITEIHMKIRMWKNDEKFDVAFETDLDNMITDRTKKAVGDEIAKIQNDIRNKVNAKIAEKRAVLQKQFDAKKAEVMAKVKDYENKLNEKLAQLETKKKELEKRIDDEKNKATDQVKKKATDALKGLFKK